MRARCFVLLALLAVSIAPSFGQSPEDRARIDYETARLALEAGNHAVASRKLESVIQVLGEQPELLSLAAQCYLSLDQLETASRYVERAFAASNEDFRATAAFDRLVTIAAALDLKKAAVANAEAEAFRERELKALDQALNERRAREARESLERGWAAVRARFQDTGRGTILDELTSLEWSNSDNGADVDWEDASDYCEDIRLGEFKDWRLPSVEELSALHSSVKALPHEPLSCFVIYKGKKQLTHTHVWNPVPGIRVSCYNFWSSTRAGNQAWTVSFDNGIRMPSGVRYETHRALCVRKAGS